MTNGQEPATKQHLEQLRSDVDQKLEQLGSEMNHHYNDVIERIRDSETNLLKAFYNYAETNNKRMAQIEGTLPAFFDRLGTLENRILQIEKRLNMPPSG